MKKPKVFHVEVKETYFVCIEADSKQEAIELVESGDGDIENGNIDIITTGYSYEVKDCKEGIYGAIKR